LSWTLDVRRSAVTLKQSPQRRDDLLFRYAAGRS
jgi:hypothetical protein